MLADWEIRSAIENGEITIEPETGWQAAIQPASLDIRLGHRFAKLVKDSLDFIDPRLDQQGNWEYVTIGEGSFYVLHPGEMVLACTAERIGLSDSIAARVEGKSSLGRLGLLVHQTAGFVDPGWAQASITLELSTNIGVPVRLYPGMPIGQLAFERVSAVQSPYTGKYVDQEGPTASRYHQNWLGNRWA